MTGYPLIDMNGQTFGRLTVISHIKYGKWKCRCECGNLREVAGADLRKGKSNSCGCLQLEIAAQSSKTHGMSKSPEYRAWSNSNDRCSDPGKNHKWYGSRGIIVCDRWKYSFENFIADMGARPSPEHSIDRQNNDGNYEPGNCRWATKLEQSNNRRNNIVVKFRGEEMTLKQAVQK